MAEAAGALARFYLRVIERRVASWTDKQRTDVCNISQAVPFEFHPVYSLLQLYDYDSLS